MAQITREQALKIIDMALTEIETLKRSNIGLGVLETELIQAKNHPSPNGLDTPLFDRLYGIEARLTDLAQEVDATPSFEFRNNNTVAGFVRKVTKEIPEGEFRLSDSLRRIGLENMPKTYWEVKKENLLFLSKIVQPTMTEGLVEEAFHEKETKKMKK